MCLGLGHCCYQQFNVGQQRLLLSNTVASHYTQDGIIRLASVQAPPGFHAYVFSNTTHDSVHRTICYSDNPLPKASITQNIHQYLVLTVFLQTMQIFNSLSEIETQHRHLSEVEKHLQHIQSTLSAFTLLPEATVEPLFAERIRSLESSIAERVEAIEGICLMADNDCILPEEIEVGELVEHNKELPEWFEVALKKELEKHKPSLNQAIKKLFKSMFTDYEKQALKSDRLNLEVLIKRMTQFQKTKLSNSQLQELLMLQERFNHTAGRYKLFLQDCGKKVMHFVKQNQEKALNFSNMNKVYVDNIPNPGEYRGYSYPEVQERVSQRRVEPYNEPLFTRPMTMTMAPQDVYYRKPPPLPTSTMPSFNRPQPFIAPLQDTGRNFYYRTANSISRQSASYLPSYPANNLYREFYY